MNLPTILSGPILRRADPSEVYIWIALSEKYQIGAHIYQIEKEQDSQSFTYSFLSDQSEAESIQVGKNLFIYLLKVTPKRGMFPENCLLGYNLFFQKGSEVVDLNYFGLLTSGDPNSIVYGNLAYPSFYIDCSNQTNLLYGSCRKLHGKGEDALASADSKLGETYLTLEDRPSSLFLMGDQIYADDVADPLLPYISTAGAHLIGQYEKLENLEQRLSMEPFATSINQIQGRQYIMEQFCKFTSSHSHNHLMTLGEFAAMYILSWGPQLWETLFEIGAFPSFADVLQEDKLYFVFPEHECYQKERETECALHESRYNEHLVDLLDTYRDLRRIRRLLANTPTYMIFDDHDITDDWNLTLDWKESVQNSELGRQVISNGLCAYWLFQGWGNDPESYDSLFIRQMTTYFQEFDVTQATHQRWQDTLLKFDSWHFVAPTSTKAIFLDTRTQRGYDTRPRAVKLGHILEEKERPPQLISSEGWGKTTDRLRQSRWNKGDPLIIVSPTPVYGIGLIESFLNQYVYPLKVVGVQVNSTFDFESWKYNGEGFTNLLYQLKEWNPSEIYIVSGDVHYASTVISNVEFRDKEQMRIHQFTSSPMNNMSFSGLWGFLMKLAIRINVAKRKKKEITRYSDESHLLIKPGKNQSCPSSFSWKERITYLSMSDSAIIHLKNNTGFLKISSTSIQNSLLAPTEKNVCFDSIQKRDLTIK